MAYTPSGLNLLIPANSDISNGTTTQNNPNVWYYNSPDTLAQAQATGYFSDNGTAGRGMKLYDIVIVAAVGIPQIPMQYVSAINATTGAATVSNFVTP